MPYGSLNIDAMQTSSGQVLGAGNATGFKNRIINGAMQIDQRNAGAAQTYTAGAAAVYGIDRFIAFCSGANVTGQRITGLSTFQYGYRFTGASGVTGISFGQRIESNNIYDLSGSTVTLSAVIANSLLTTVTWAAYYANTADNFSAITLISSGSFTVTSTATKYSTNITFPANAQNGVYIVFGVGAQTSGTWDITGVQLEVGSTATSFDVRDYGRELIMCQRYCNVLYTLGGSQRAWASGYGSSAVISPAIYFSTPMRAAASVSLTNAGNVQFYYPGVGWSSSTLVYYATDFNALNQPTSVYFSILVETSGVVRLVWNPTNTCVATITAEL